MFYISYAVYCSDPKFSNRQFWANIVDPDQTDVQILGLF